MSLHRDVRAWLGRTLGATAATDEKVLNDCLHMLAKYRATLLSNTLVMHQGTVVAHGPFAGMEFVAQSSEGCHAPKLLGCYEAELHDFLRAAPGANYAAVLNIGCAEGYYAVGLKRMLPMARVLAFDIDQNARDACRALADRNKEAIEIGGRFDPVNFSLYAVPGRRVLVWCDIEGAELELLDPVAAPALLHMDIVVELHRIDEGHTVDIIPGRFETSHAIEIVHARVHDPALPEFIRQLSHLDQLLMQWEWRQGPTPWAVMRARELAG